MRGVVKAAFMGCLRNAQVGFGHKPPRCAQTELDDIFMRRYAAVSLEGPYKGGS